MTRKLRSQARFGGQDNDGFIHRSWMKNNGLPDDVFDGRPVIGIYNAHFRELIIHIKADVLEAGGLPLEFPVFSCGESNLRPTAMLFRNPASMDVEESICANPTDGVVLIMGCDKTTPSLVIGTATCNLPTIGVSSGPMLNRRYRGKPIGSSTDVWKFSEAVRSDEMTMAEFAAAEFDDSALEINESSIMVLRNCGPRVYAGMAEVGNMALPKKLLAKDVRDMVRISDARMSGTAFGAVVLHAAPEVAVGGSLALAKSGDEIMLDVAGRRLEPHVGDAELASRHVAFVATQRNYRSGYETLYVNHVQQADCGADLDFLVGRRGAALPGESH